RPDLLQALQQLGGTTKITDWFLFGPFQDTNLDARLASEPFPFTANITDASGQKRSWTRVSGKPLSGRVSVREALKLEAMSTNAVVYAAALLPGTGSQEAELQVETDVPLTLWLNGQKVFTRSAGSLSAVKLPVTLKIGPNVLLARLDQAGRAAQLSVRVPN